MADVPPGPYFTAWELAHWIVNRTPPGEPGFMDHALGKRSTLRKAHAAVRVSKKRRREAEEHAFRCLSAFRKIADAARDGHITAIGRPARRGLERAEFEVIPSSFWITAGFDPAGHRDFAIAETHGHAAFAAGAMQYLDPRFPQSEAKKVWPEPTVASEAPTASPPSTRKSARGKTRGPWFSRLPSFLTQRLAADPAYLDSPRRTLHAEARAYFAKEDPGEKLGKLPKRTALDTAIRAAEPKARELHEARVAQRRDG